MAFTHFYVNNFTSLIVGTTAGLTMMSDLSNAADNSYDLIGAAYVELILMRKRH